MQRCLQLAANGIGATEPNPYVGAVIVHQDEIIGEGFHEFYGGPHAEVNAIASVKDKDLLRESTLYVSLEPCSHYGKTPPCTELITQHRIPEVVIAMLDPNPLVAGKGIEFLQNSMLKVSCGILESEARWINRRFITYHTKNRPYIILKWAQTLDGFIDVARDNKNRSAADNWITGPELKTLVHQWRSQEQAIMIGYNTLLNDNPQLNTRYWSGRSPLKILVSEEIPDENFQLFSNPPRTIVVNSKASFVTEKAEYVQLSFDLDLPFKIIRELFTRNISSVIIEGGRRLLDTFIAAGLWDEARILTGNKSFFNGLKAPELRDGKLIEEQTFGHDVVRYFTNPVAP